MANVDAQGIKCLGVHMEKEGHTNDKLVAAWNAAKAKRPAEVLDKPMHTGNIARPGNVSVWDLPIGMSGPARNTTTVVDVVNLDEDLPINVDAVSALMDAGKYNHLPGKLAFLQATDIPVTMNLYIGRQPDGVLTAVKFLQFLNSEKIATIRAEMIQGDMFFVQ